MIRSIYITITSFLFCVTANAQSWLPATPPPSFLTHHTFGFAINGKGYLVAGTTEFDGHANTFLQYDPESDEWTTLDTFPGGARGYAIGDVWDGKAYFGFGATTSAIKNDLWVFDPDLMKWTELDTCPCEPRLHPAFVAHNGKIFAGLGNGNNGNLNDWWEYDIATNQWSRKQDFPDLPRHHPYQFAVGDYVYTGFGHGGDIFNDWYRYDPVNEVWDTMSTIPAEGRVAGTQFSYADKGYVLSGEGEDHLSMDEGEFWAYDPVLNEWTQLPPHPGKSRWAPSSFIIDGVVYLFNGTTYFNTVGYVYQTEAYKFNLDPKIVYPNIERVVSHLYNSVIYDMEPMSHGRWALAVKDAFVPHTLWCDSLSIVILDSLGEIDKQIGINAFLHNEITEMGPIWVLPNDEILIRYGVGNWDAGIFEYVLEKFDAGGTSVWHFILEDWDTPTSMSLAPDGNILYQYSVMVMKISSETGEIMWQNGYLFDSPSSYLFVPGTEDIILGDTSGLKYYSPIIMGEWVQYELTNSYPMDLGKGYLTLLGLDESGMFYGMNSESKEIYRFRKDLVPKFVMVLPNGSNEFHNKYSFSKDHLAIGLNFPNLEVMTFDTLGQLIKSFEYELEGVSVNDIELTKEGLAVSGNYQSGTTADDYPSFLIPEGRMEGWFKFISNYSAEDSMKFISLSITDIEQLEAPVIDSFFSPGPDPGTLYNISGGKFRIQLVNTGDEEIYSFSLNTIFSYRTNVGFCAPFSAGFIDYENHSIAPGESIWVEYIGLLAEDQRNIPPQFCFWTSSPNNLPDVYPNDDLHCIDNTVSIPPLAKSLISIYPNPADKEIEVIRPSEYTDSKWSLMDTYGRILKKGTFVQSNSSINISELPEGIYFLIGDGVYEKIIICH